MTLVTRDIGLYQKCHCHSSSCVVVVAPEDALASFVLQLLRDPRFHAHALRMGKVLRLQRAGIVYWERDAPREIHVEWT